MNLPVFYEPKKLFENKASTLTRNQYVRSHIGMYKTNNGGRDSYITANNGGFGNYPSDRPGYRGGSIAIPKVVRSRSKFPDIALLQSLVVPLPFQF